jgi:FkbM family methyltransferase
LVLLQGDASPFHSHVLLSGTWRLMTVARSIFGKMARYPLTWLPPDQVVPVLCGPVRGSRWIMGSARHAYWLGTYEYDKQKQIAKELSPSSVFYDLGANVGFYTLLAAKRATAGRVYAFEPLPRNIEFLRRHLELNRVRNAGVLELAVSDVTGPALFKEAGNSFMGRLEGGGKLNVLTATLDGLLQQGRILPPSVIKIDVEGAELLALRGSREVFQQFRPVLFLATHGREVHAECVQLLALWKYECKDLGDGACKDSGEIVARYRPSS